jgi:hypothetical protein
MCPIGDVTNKTRDYQIFKKKLEKNSIPEKIRKNMNILAM